MNPGQVIKSIAKVLLRPRRASVQHDERSEPLIILGNGPSLNATLEHDRAALESSPLLAVNFFANSPEFRRLKPEYYVLADPHFFDNADDPNVARLMENLAAVDWPMTLFLPVKKSFPNLRVEYFPMTAVEGARRLESAAYSARLGMPRPRNVLIPSIMIGVWLGYKEIYIVGADHTWPASVSVNERNEVVTLQPHFYKEDSRELERIRTVYMRVPLHQLLESWRVAFHSYHLIQRWTESLGVHVYNATPGSFIDAFERKPL